MLKYEASSISLALWKGLGDLEPHCVNYLSFLSALKSFIDSFIHSTLLNLRDK
jgi:hypothetical protein